MGSISAIAKKTSSHLYVCIYIQLCNYQQTLQVMDPTVSLPCVSLAKPQPTSNDKTLSQPLSFHTALYLLALSCFIPGMFTCTYRTQQYTESVYLSTNGISIEAPYHTHELITILYSPTVPECRLYLLTIPIVPSYRTHVPYLCSQCRITPLFDNKTISNGSSYLQVY